MTADLEENQLALSVRAGEDGALERLICLYQDGLYGYALRLLGNEFDAQEAVQDALLRAWYALASRYDEARCRSLALRPWLFRITRNAALNRRRSRGRELTGDPEADPPAPDGGSYDRSALLEPALGVLTGSERELIVLRYFEQMPYPEIAAVLGRTDSAVRGGVFRALRKLRHRLNEMGYFHAL